ncbi:MAG TPA: aminotransferase class III-fold pyridoxal phosphate-dependent enzyme [Thermoleophilia bacterium]|nr:aminotransferase class III-fold pyridoxal phosphate-dependent enzyme [Thermoleophilia bacterium]
MSHYGPSRELVVDVCRTLLDRGYLKATEGNVSVRVPGEDAMAITPSSYDYGKMEPGDICVQELDGRQVLGSKKASIEASMHAAVYELRDDVSVIIHTHQPYASALALMERPIPALFDEQVRYLGRSVELIPYAPSGTGFLKKNVTKKVGSGANAFILENHGVLVLGGSAEQAVHNMALLEKVALDYLLALLTDGRAEKVPLPIREVAFQKLRKDEKKLARQVEEAKAAREASELRAREESRTAAGEPGAAPSAGAAPPVAAASAGPSGAQLAGYAIGRYPDVPAVYERLDALVGQPLRPLRRDVMDGVLAWYDRSCRRSKELTAAAAELIPGGVQHNLAFNYPFPLAIVRAEGAHLWDVDGNEYIDFLQAGGPTVLGSNYEPVRRQVAEVVEQSGPITGLFHEYELKLAELVNRLMPSVEMFRMLGSGTESVMAALRAARTFTGKKWVIKVGGAYHGWSDQMVYGLHVPGTWRFEAKGIPFGATSLTREVFPNDLDALRRKLRQNHRMGGTAAVIVEPVGPESGTRPVPFGFNAAVRELCDEFGALLIFDEVVTGFRLGMGGAQGYYGVRPDLTIFGKCITGGYPMAGGVGGRRDVLASFAGGIGGKSGERAYVGGTLSANPLSCAAGYFAITEMERTGAPVLAGMAGDRLTAGLNGIIDKYGLPFVAYNQGSIVHLETSGVMLLDLKHPVRFARQMKPRKHMIEEMGAAYAANGIVTLAGSRMYTSMADTDEVIDDALERFERVLSSVEGV